LNKCKLFYSDYLVKQPEERSNTKTTTIMEKKRIEPKKIIKLVPRSRESKEQGELTVPELRNKRTKKSKYQREGAARLEIVQNISI